MKSPHFHVGRPHQSGFHSGLHFLFEWSGFGFYMGSPCCRLSRQPLTSSRHKGAFFWISSAKPSPGIAIESLIPVLGLAPRTVPRVSTIPALFSQSQGVQIPKDKKRGKALLGGKEQKLFLSRLSHTPAPTLSKSTTKNSFLTGAFFHPSQKMNAPSRGSKAGGAGTLVRSIMPQLQE